MRAEHVNPFISSLTDTFQTMLACSLNRGGIYLRDSESCPHEVSGIIGLSGITSGTVVLSMEREVALKAAGTLLMCEPTEIDSDVIDAVGEITNIVAGQAKAQLEQYNLSLSLPNVVLGRAHRVCYPSDVRPICIPFTCAWGSVLIEIGLAAVPEPALA